MTVHGNQYLLPFFIREGSHPLSIQGHDELALAFYLLSKDLGKNEKILSFSRLLWPILSIQGVIGTHIMLDGLNIFSKKGKFSNPPRQPLIGHILRNIDNRTKIDQLKILTDVLTYKDLEAEEIGEGEESEFQTLKIDGLINPDFLQSLLKIIPLIEYKPITEYTVLDTAISTENALDIAEDYRQIIETMKGNAYRWKTQIELINKEVSKWFIDINVQLKDVDSRYSSQISKASSSIDSTQIDEKAKLEQDRIDQWSVNEKKRVIENITTLFKTLERFLEELIKKNKFFTSESLKSRVFEDLMTHFETHFNYLQQEGRKFLDSTENLKQKFNELKTHGSQIDLEVKQKIEEFKSSLQIKLKDRDKQLTEFESEKQVKLSELENLKSQFENQFQKIKEIIQLKQNECLQEAQSLTSWSLNDNQSDLFTRPIQWIYLPVYVMFIEDSNNLEEFMNIIFPGHVRNDPNNIYNDISEAFTNLKMRIKERVEDDMGIRSNFEFSCERNNLIKDSNLGKKIQLGISKLRENLLLNETMENIIRNNLNLIT